MNCTGFLTEVSYLGCGPDPFVMFIVCAIALIVVWWLEVF